MVRLQCLRFRPQLARALSSKFDLRHRERAPWLLDLSLAKAISLAWPKENGRVEFRVAFFNVFNHPRFANPEQRPGLTRIRHHKQYGCESEGGTIGFRAYFLILCSVG